MSTEQTIKQTHEGFEIMLDAFEYVVLETTDRHSFHYAIVETSAEAISFFTHSIEDGVTYRIDYGSMAEAFARYTHQIACDCLSIYIENEVEGLHHRENRFMKKVCEIHERDIQRAMAHDKS